MEYDLRLLRAFAAVADEGSFTKAAARVGVTQSSLSLQIQRLEQSLGVPLFRRTTRSVTLTDEGAQLLDSARVITDRLEIMRLDVRRMRMETAKELHVGTAFFTLDIPVRNQLLESFSRFRPDIRLRVHDAPQPELISAISNGRIEIAIVMGSAHSSRQPDYASPPGTYPEALTASLLGSRRIGLLCPRESSLVKEREIDPRLLTGMRIAMIDAGQHPEMHKDLAETLLSVGAEPYYHFEACHALAVERFAARERIPCISVGWFHQPQTAADMIWAPLSRPSWRIDVAVLRRRELSTMAETFIAHARTSFGPENA